MKNNIKEAPAKFREDLLHFQHFMPSYVIITTLNFLIPQLQLHKLNYQLSVYSILGFEDKSEGIGAGGGVCGWSARIK